MNEFHPTHQQPDAAAALRAQRRSDAVVAQYLRELSGRPRGVAGSQMSRPRGADHSHKAREVVCA